MRYAVHRSGDLQLSCFGIGAARGAMRRRRDLSAGPAGRRAAMGHASGPPCLRCCPACTAAGAGRQTAWL